VKMQKYGIQDTAFWNKTAAVKRAVLNKILQKGNHLLHEFI
jgi:hypothetical protein